MKASYRIACFGDSLTEGYGLSQEAALPSVLQGLLQEENVKTTCLNFGVSGETAEDGLQRIDQVIKAMPHAAIVAFGANDCFVGDDPHIVKANLAATIERLQSHSIVVLLVGISALTNDDETYRSAFNPIFGELANQYSTPLMPDILACYFHDSSLKLMDGMHPNERGVERIADDMVPYVMQMLSQINR